MEQSDITKLAKVIWDYHVLNQEPVKSDCIIALGNSDLRTAERAADLYLNGYGDWLITTGGLGRLTSKLWNKPEAQMFAEVALKLGVPKNKILIEDKATNTFDNLRFSTELLEKRGVHVNSALVVTKPYMERRAYAMCLKLWSNKQITVASPKLSFDNYPTKDIPMELLINMVVGDLQRITVYSDRGEAEKQTIPPAVEQAYNKLIALGYNKQLLDVSKLPKPNYKWPR